MGCRKTWILGAALCGALLCGANSQAGTITFLATGTFDSGLTPGTPVFTAADGVTSVTDSATLSTASVPPTNNVNLGMLTTASTESAGTPQSVSSNFTLTVENTVTMDTITFSGVLSGSISSTTSNASIIFSSPLTQTLDGFIFTIVSADQGNHGQVNLNAPTTNGGTSTINAAVSVPEPASVVLLGLAVPALAGLRYRRARR
jgi:PEP-CTERM motif